MPNILMILTESVGLFSDCFFKINFSNFSIFELHGTIQYKFSNGSLKYYIFTSYSDE